jgi:hypothetical protein
MADVPVPTSGVIGGIVGGVGVALLLWTVRRKAAIEGGEGILTYGLPLRVFVVVFWVFWLGLVGLVVVQPPDDPVGVATAVCGLFALILPLHLEFFGVRVSFDEAGIRTRSPWRAERQIPWPDIRQGWYSSVLQWHVIQTEGYGRVRLHDLMSGVDSLLDELRRRDVPVASPRDPGLGPSGDRHRS